MSKYGRAVAPCPLEPLDDTTIDGLHMTSLPIIFDEMCTSARLLLVERYTRALFTIFITKIRTLTNVIPEGPLQTGHWGVNGMEEAEVAAQDRSI